MTASKAATIYARANEYIIQPQSRTGVGVWIGCEPVQLLSRDVASTTLGEAILGALAVSREGVPHPRDCKAILLPLLKCAKIRSWNALQKTAMSRSVRSASSEICLVPSRNGGTSGPDKGYSPLSEDAIVLSLDCTSEELGEAALEALSFCC